MRNTLIFTYIALLYSLALGAQMPSYLGKDTSSLPKLSADDIDQRNLTDHERWMTKNYVHEGYHRRAYEEACLEQDDETYMACQGLEVDGKVLGINRQLVKGLSMMYGLVLGTGVTGDFKKPKVDGEGNPLSSDGEVLTKNSEGKLGTIEKSPDGGEKFHETEQGEDKVPDYCRYVAAGTEALGMANQLRGQEEINRFPPPPGDEQRDSLFRAARAHKQRSNSAKIQGIGWGATTACYAYMNFGPSTGAPGWQGLVKLGAAAALTAFWWDEVNFHKKYADEMKKLARSLPGAGDCNPVDDPQCYCAQPETQYDPKYCITQYTHANNLPKDSLAISCIDDKLQEDPECRCLERNNCYDQVIAHHFEGLGFGPGFTGGAFSNFNKLMQGELTEGKVSGGSLEGQHRAALNRVMSQINDHLGDLPDQGLSPELESLALDAKKLGVPSRLARKMASYSNQTNMGKTFSPGKQDDMSQDDPYLPQVMYFGRPNQFGSHDSFSSSNHQYENPFAKFLNKDEDERGEDHDRVMHFRGRALAGESAQISRYRDLNLFEIISQRYMRSAGERLDLRD